MGPGRKDLGPKEVCLGFGMAHSYLESSWSGGHARGARMWIDLELGRITSVYWDAEAPSPLFICWKRDAFMLVDIA
jgi:hypothetical protein